jgi:hypothetical protein
MDTLPDIEHPNWHESRNEARRQHHRWIERGHCIEGK